MLLIHPYIAHCHRSVPPSFTVHHEAPPKAEDIYQVPSEQETTIPSYVTKGLFLVRRRAGNLRLLLTILSLKLTAGHLPPAL